MNRLLVRPCCIRRAKTSDAFRGVDLVIAGPAAAVTGSNRVSIGPTGRSTTGAKAPAPVNDGNARALAGAWSADRGSLELIRSSRGASGIVVAAGVPPGGAAPGAVRKHGSTGRLAMDGGGTSRFASIDPVANGTRRHRSKFELDREAGPFQGLAYDRTTKSRADGSTIIVSTSLSAGAYRPDRWRLVSAEGSIGLAVEGSDRARTGDRASSWTSRSGDVLAR